MSQQLLTPPPQTAAPVIIAPTIVITDYYGNFLQVAEYLLTWYPELVTW